MFVRFLSAVLAGLATLMMALVALAQEDGFEGDFSFSDTPDWVLETPLDPLAGALYDHIDGGQAILLYDRQFAWIDGAKHAYMRNATEVTNRGGLEAVAQIIRDYDPSRENLRIVRLELRRGGEVIDFRGVLSPEIYRRERQLDAGIVDGLMTVHLDLPDVRIGDVVDVAAIWEQQELLPGDLMTGRADLEFSVPVGNSQVVINWPDEKALTLAAVPEGVESEVGPGGIEGATRHVWRLRNADPVLPDRQYPRDLRVWGGVQFTGYESWQEVSGAINAHYADPHPAPEAWAGKLDQIRAEYADDAARAYAALRLVQDEIRYVGIEIGTGGYYARPPAQVVAQGYGDCKDKAVLLQALLADLGIEAFVALARLDEGHKVRPHVPTPRAFDHMILGAKIDGVIHWMDATSSFEGGITGGMVTPDYGWVLPLTGPEDTLVKIVPPEGEQYYDSDVVERFRFSREGVELSVKGTYRRQSANNVRARWMGQSMGARVRDYERFYGDLYPGISIKVDPVMVDDRAANVVTIEEVYFLTREALEKPYLLTDFPFSASSMVDYYPQDIGAERGYDLGIVGRVRERHKIVVANAPIEFDPPEGFALSNPAFDYRFKAFHMPRGGMQMEWSYESHGDTIARAALDEVFADVRAQRENRSWYWDLTPDAPSPNTRSLLERLFDK